MDPMVVDVLVCLDGDLRASAHWHHRSYLFTLKPMIQSNVRI